MTRLFLSLYLLLLGGSFLYWTASDAMLAHRHQAFADQYTTRLARGPLLTTSRFLAQRAPETWPAIMASLSADYGETMVLKRWPELHLPDEDWDHLHEEDIFILDDIFERPGQVALHLVHGTDYILCYGPMPEPAARERLDLGLQLGWIAILTAVMLIWVFALYRKLKALENASLAFGRGNFSARVKIADRGYLGRLGATFDHMATRLEDLLQTQRELIQAVSHELRTPLSRLAFSRHFLATAEQPAQRQELLDDMQRDIGGLESLVDELLQYAHLDLITQTTRPERIDFLPWLESLVAPHRHGHDRHLDFSCREPQTVPHLEILPELLEKALNNLITNALRHANHEVAISVTATRDRVSVHVDDDGPGIPVDQRARVFEPFVRLDASRNAAKGGVGLGAALARRIARRHGGDVTIAESPIGGARFTLELPTAAVLSDHQAEGTNT
ncbi:Histidine kinase [Sulfidibacter corallicola]|uniref:histidine kinase n=1 Tax=Sulfidibacter corallicola TaxID=2818388 RepID=A0A8A4TVQ1_SULCO|nr:ATP-binding protein [Sulfidibacter corallicola]QTD54036.1 hypothetical protein J3U87_16445 [Sulfidibacter corallicola]